jgi:hypothetical protein
MSTEAGPPAAGSSTFAERLLVLATTLVLAVIVAAFLLLRTSGSAATGGAAQHSGTLLVGDAAVAAALSEPIERGRIPFILYIPLAQAEDRLHTAGFQNVVVANPKTATGDTVTNVDPQIGTFGDSQLEVRVTLDETPPPSCLGDCVGSP